MFHNLDIFLKTIVKRLVWYYTETFSICTPYVLKPLSWEYRPLQRDFYPSMLFLRTFGAILAEVCNQCHNYSQWTLRLVKSFSKTNFFTVNEPFSFEMFHVTLLVLYIHLLPVGSKLSEWSTNSDTLLSDKDSILLAHLEANYYSPSKAVIQ